MRIGDLVWSGVSDQHYFIVDEQDFGAGGVSYELSHFQTGRGGRPSIEVFAPAKSLFRVIPTFAGFVGVGKLGR